MEAGSTESKAGCACRTGLSLYHRVDRMENATAQPKELIGASFFSFCLNRFLTLVERLQLEPRPGRPDPRAQRHMHSRRIVFSGKNEN